MRLIAAILLIGSIAHAGTTDDSIPDAKYLTGRGQSPLRA
jgi:hypothetical protein